MTLLTLLNNQTAAPPSPSIRVRELPPLAVDATGVAPNGHSFRWGRDAPNAADRLTGARWSDTMPGGFDRGGAVLARDPGVDYSDLARLSTITFRGSGGEAVGEYRLERAPRVSGERMSVSPDLAGWQAHLEDDRSASCIYRDADLSRWTGPSAARRLSLINSSAPHQSDASTAWDTSASALILSLQGAWGGGVTPRCEAWYDAGAGNKVGSVVGGFQGWPDPNWQLFAAVSDANGVVQEKTADLYTAASGSFAFNPTSRFRWAWLQWTYGATPSGADGSTFSVRTTPVVYGDHGLPVVGTEPAAGLLASDIVAHAVGRWAPLLQFSVGAGGTIAPSAFPIPHATFTEFTTVAQIVQEVIKYELPDWAVWEDRAFWMHPRGARGRSWVARVAPAGLEETGPQIDRVWNGILVSFTDPDGSTRVVGPPGSGADVEDAQLLDADPDNPANQLNMRRWDILSMGMVSTAGAATQVGARFLQESKRLSTAGRARFVGYVEDSSGIVWPYHAVRAGDTVAFVNSADPSPRRIVQSDKDADSRTCTVDLDSPPDGLGALLARLGVVLVPLGL